MKLMTTAITALFLSIGLANAQPAGNLVKSYNAPPTQQEMDAMANSGWNLIAVVPVVANGNSKNYVAYFDSLPPKASKGVNCTYETLGGGTHSEWYSGEGPTDKDKDGKYNLICR